MLVSATTTGGHYATNRVLSDVLAPANRHASVAVFEAEALKTLQRTAASIESLYDRRGEVLDIGATFREIINDHMMSGTRQRGFHVSGGSK